MQSSHLTAPGSHVLTKATSSEHYFYGGRMRETVGSDNGVGSAGITEHASKQRAGAEQRNSTQNRLTGAQKQLPILLNSITSQRDERASLSVIDQACDFLVAK